MQVAFAGKNRRFLPLHNRVLIILFWCLGLITGYFFGMQTPVQILSLMRTSLSERVSIVCRMISLFLPFFFFFVILRFLTPVLFIPLAFLKAYSFAFCYCCISIAFGYAGWLMRIFYLFSDSCSLVLLIWFLLSHFTWEREKNIRELAVCFAVIGLLSCFDYFIASPFSAMLMNY